MQLTDLCEALISYKQKRSRRDVGHDLQNHHSFIRSNKLWTSISSSQVPSPCHSTQPWFSLVDSQGSEAKALSSLSTTGPPTKIRNVSPSYGGDPLIHHIHHGMEYGTRMYIPVILKQTQWVLVSYLVLSLLNIPSLSGYACHIHAASFRYGAHDLNWSSVLMQCCHPLF